MSAFSAIDLSRLPAPQVIETPSFDAMLSEMKAEAVNRYPELAPYLALESEPMTKLLRVCAYFRMLDRLSFNDGARGCMLALATGPDLDQLAAFWGVERLVVQDEDDSVNPPIEQIVETDAAFRARVQLSLEGHSSAGPVGAYTFFALSADGAVKDASVISPVPGDVLVTVLSHLGDGTPSSGLLSRVEAALNDEDVRPLCDTVTVQAATIVPYAVTATLTLYEGPDETAVRAAAEGAVADFVRRHHALGHDITRSGLFAALHQAGVQNVTLSAPAADLVIGSAEAAHCPPDAIAITIGGRDV